MDRADIWDCRPHPGIFEEDFTYAHLVELVKEGNEEEIRRKFSSIYRHMTPSKLPAGKRYYSFRQMEMWSRLSLSEANVDVRIGNIHLEGFLHAGRKFGIVRVNLPLEDFSYYVENPEFGIDSESTGAIDPLNGIDTASLKNLCYPAPIKVRLGNLHYFVQQISEEFSYGVFAVSKQEGNNSLIAFAVGTSKDGNDWKEALLEELQTALEAGYDSLFEEHCVWWKNFWEKSEITLPDSFMERNWYMTNYLLASCSRKGGYPMQLQGLWTADDGKLPPWHGDYHHDLNTQMSYMHYLKANHLEEGESFTDYLWEMADKGREFARSFYGTEGLCLPSIMGIDGTALGGWAMYSFSPTNQIWLCQAFERYYRYTGDRRFLEERAYPYMKETGKLILGLLMEKDGKYYLPVSSSPEIHDDTIGAFVTPNSNYDLALMRYLFLQLSELAEELGSEEAKRWQKVLKKLPELAVNEQGILMLSPDEELKESHRHHSHLMGIHPLRLLDYHSEEGKRIIDASILQLEQLGSGWWVGFSFAWMAELYAIQGNGNGAAHQLRTFWDSFCSQNGFHLNGDYKNHGISQWHYRPFTLEGNMCAADALQEMLLQSEKGVVTAFTIEETRGGRVKVKMSSYLEKMAEKFGWQQKEGCYILTEGSLKL